MRRWTAAISYAEGAQTPQPRPLARAWSLDILATWSRGRDAGFPAPPAQIPAGGFPAPGSSNQLALAYASWMAAHWPSQYASAET